MNIEQIKAERDAAIKLLADWCVDIDCNGTGWDDWDENYKTARYRPGILREALDKAIQESSSYYNESA